MIAPTTVHPPIGLDRIALALALLRQRAAQARADTTIPPGAGPTAIQLSATSAAPATPRLPLLAWCEARRSGRPAALVALLPAAHASSRNFLLGIQLSNKAIWDTSVRWRSNECAGDTGRIAAPRSAAASAMDAWKLRGPGFCDIQVQVPSCTQVDMLEAGPRLTKWESACAAPRNLCPMESHAVGIVFVQCAIRNLEDSHVPR